MLCDGEKKGGAGWRSSSCRFFNHFCSSWGLRDMGFSGPKFNWNRGLLFERIDRALCNHAWEVLAPSTTVHHLHKIQVDHRPLDIGFGQMSLRKPVKPFRFISAWLSHKEFGSFVHENWHTVD